MPKTKQMPPREEEDLVEESGPSKIKKGFDLEVGDGIPVDKTEESDGFEVATAEDDGLEDEAEIDGEELNPFGDKWEE